MSRKRVLVAHPYVRASGGGNVVAAWALQALRQEFDVTLATLGPLDFAAVNRNMGTSLAAGDFPIRIASLRFQIPLRCLPTRGALMQVSLLMRWAQELDAREHFDVLLGMQNESDFGRRGIQYVHYPSAFMPRPKIEMRWFHHIPGFLAAYRRFCWIVAPNSNAGARRNLSLANSAFVAGRIAQVHGVESAILYPPVPGEFPAVSWERRRCAVAAVGRMHPFKRWEMAVEILDRVRRGGLDLGLTLIASTDERAYSKRIAKLAASRPWFRILSDISREQLVQEVASHRYGIHTMLDEHFGIAPAELLRAGCIPFVHDSGGPVEIVGGRRELCFPDAAGGAEKISAVVRTPQLEELLRLYVHSRRDCFSTQRFCDGLRRVIRDFC